MYVINKNAKSLFQLLDIFTVSCYHVHIQVDRENIGLLLLSRQNQIL